LLSFAFEIHYGITLFFKIFCVYNSQKALCHVGTYVYMYVCMYVKDDTQQKFKSAMDMKKHGKRSGFESRQSEKFFRSLLLGALDQVHL
jgi:hypothetical protein